MSQTRIPIVAADAPAATHQRKRQGTKGRPVLPQALAEVQSLLGPGPYRRDLLIEYLHLLQDRYLQLGTPHLAALAQLLRLAQAEVYEVASFYHHFDVVREDAGGAIPAPPALTVRVCSGLSCAMAGAAELLQRLPALLGREVRVIPAPCVGRCERAPVAVVHQKPVLMADAAAVKACVDSGLREDTAGDWLKLQDCIEQGGYRLLHDCLEGRRSVESVLQAMDDSGLRGLGGAGFPAGRKWKIVRAQAAPRLMAVNIDEGEPGTFKDRWLLERDPHRFLEGMFVAAWAVDVSRIVIYLRDEYHGCRQVLQAALQEARAAFGDASLPAVELRRGAGAYICGEESAMSESIEGKRGLPRLRPPYVAEVGLFGRPTLQHNFETLYWVRQIVEEGPASFAAHGRHGRKGLRNFSVSGRVREPGVKLAPAGITLRELVAEYCGGMAEGHTLYAYLPGGASGGILPARLADVPLDFDTLQPYGCFIGSAAVIVLSHHDRAVGAARNMMQFFEHESCGQCTPCRSGTAKASALMAGVAWDRSLLADLGQAAPNVFDCVIKYFPQELQP